jgi:putative ABC transport system permease protein
MAMAAIVEGIRSQIVTTIEVAGPTTFYVLKKFSQTPLNPDNLPKEVRSRPDISELEADRLRRLPEVAYASMWAQTLARIESNDVRSQRMAIFGADDGFTRIQGGELVEGRWFTSSVRARRSSCCRKPPRAACSAASACWAGRYRWEGVRWS